MVIESIQAGAKDFMVKPFQADRVLEAVRECYVMKEALNIFLLIVGFAAILCCILLLNL